MKTAILLIFINLYLFSAQIQSNYMLEIYEEGKILSKKLEKIKKFPTIKRALEAKFVDLNKLNKEFKKLSDFNKKAKIFNKEEIQKIKNIIKKLQVYKPKPIA